MTRRKLLLIQRMFSLVCLVCAALFPALVERGVQRVGNHRSETPFEALQSVVAVARAHQSLVDIFLHIGAGKLLCFDDVEDGLILRAVGQSADNGESLHSVVGSTMIGRMAVGVAVPTVVERRANGLHLPLVVGGVGIVPCQLRHIDSRLQGHIVPRSEQEAHIHVGSPVAPRPTTTSILSETVVVERPQGESW